MSPLRFARVESAIGPMWVAETDAGVAACTRADSPDTFLAALRRRFPEAEPVPADLDVRWLDDGGMPDVELAGLSAFDAAVYAAVREIPTGQTLTYGEVAALIGSPGAARAVGGAMSRCPLFPAVPCHRVVSASDGWSGWGSDVALKRRLLREERGEFLAARQCAGTLAMQRCCAPADLISRGCDWNTTLRGSTSRTRG